MGRAEIGLRTVDVRTNHNIINSRDFDFSSRGMITQFEKNTHTKLKLRFRNHDDLAGFAIIKINVTLIQRCMNR